MSTEDRISGDNGREQLRCDHVNMHSIHSGAHAAEGRGRQSLLRQPVVVHAVGRTSTP